MSLLLESNALLRLKVIYIVSYVINENNSEQNQWVHYLGSIRSYEVDFDNLNIIHFVQISNNRILHRADEI